MQALRENIKGKAIYIMLECATIKVTRKALMEAIRVHKPPRIESQVQGQICFVEFKQ